jgi:endonuclease/exonuclease/phosphatase family metal-dependent hydrolase
VRRSEDAAEPSPEVGAELRILTWNLAHGRGDEAPGLLRNFGGGDREDRVVRLARIAEVIRTTGAHVVVLNEADFRSSWSRGLNQAEVLARTAGYGTWVQQTNFDLRLPVGVLDFGNAVLTRLPVRETRFVELPPHSRLEALVLGAKAASLIRLETGRGPLSLVPIHLEPRSEETRLEALPVFRGLASDEAAPLILAGDFNSSPPGWAGAEARTVVGGLLEAGWRSPRALGPPGRNQWTYPTFDPARAIDWVLVEPPLEVVEARVLDGTEELSDHAPVLAVVRLPEEG